MIGSRGRWLLLNLVLASLAAVAGVGLVREVVEGRPLPRQQIRPDAGPRAPVLPAAGLVPAARPRGGAKEYAVIAARNLFTASRGEVAVVAPLAATAAPSILHGVMLDGEQSRAYLDDPIAKRVFGYAVGDQVAGGRLERILEDRVVIRGPMGTFEILLRDPSKPQPEPPAPVAAAPTKSRHAVESQTPVPPSPETPPAASADPSIPPAPGKVPQ